ncbi:MAG: hypothetical protein ACFFG0_22110 [Candidatus Thorarchaeota archaeon]
MFELKELEESREYGELGSTQEIANEKNQNQRLRELNVSMLYNLRYHEEKEKYLTNLNALRVYYNYGC